MGFGLWALGFGLWALGFGFSVYVPNSPSKRRAMNLSSAAPRVRFDSLSRSSCKETGTPYMLHMRVSGNKGALFGGLFKGILVYLGIKSCTPPPFWEIPILM